MSCTYCHDQGIVELAGHATDGYTRGSAPCRWCDAGRKLRDKLTKQKQHPLTDYAVTSLADPPKTSERIVTKAEALSEWATCEHSWQQLREPKLRPWAGNTIHFERCTRCGKEEARTQKLGPTIRGDA